MAHQQRLAEDSVGLAAAISWHWAFALGVAIFAALVFYWSVAAHQRAATKGLLIAVAAAILTPAICGRELHLGPCGWSGFWGGGLVAAALFVVWLLPRWSDLAVATIGAGGGIIFAAVVVYMSVKGASPPDWTPLALFGALWSNLAFDLEETDEIKEKPALKWALLIVGFLALALM